MGKLCTAGSGFCHGNSLTNLKESTERINSCTIYIKYTKILIYFSSFPLNVYLYDFVISLLYKICSNFFVIHNHIIKIDKLEYKGRI